MMIGSRPESSCSERCCAAAVTCVRRDVRPRCTACAASPSSFAPDQCSSAASSRGAHVWGDRLASPCSRGAPPAAASPPEPLRAGFPRRAPAVHGLQPRRHPAPAPDQGSSAAGSRDAPSAGRTPPAPRRRPPAEFVLSGHRRRGRRRRGPGPAGAPACGGPRLLTIPGRCTRRRERARSSRVELGVVAPRAAD